MWLLKQTNNLEELEAMHVKHSQSISHMNSQLKMTALTSCLLSNYSLDLFQATNNPLLLLFLNLPFCLHERDYGWTVCITILLQSLFISLVKKEKLKQSKFSDHVMRSQRICQSLENSKEKDIRVIQEKITKKKREDQMAGK